MGQATFLDTGVLLAYCFTTDTHHSKCRNYLDTEDYEIFITQAVEDEYYQKEPQLTERYSDAVLSHVADLEQSDYEGQLDPLDLAQIRDNLLDSRNPAHSFLYSYYKNEVPKFLLVDELKENIRALARDIEANAINRKVEIDERVQIWERTEEYPSLNSELDAIHSQDRGICLDAHDLAVSRDGHIELATTNPKDFVRNGHKKLLLEVTALDDVVSLAVIG